MLNLGREITFSVLQRKALWEKFECFVADHSAITIWFSALS